MALYFGVRQETQTKTVNNPVRGEGVMTGVEEGLGLRRLGVLRGTIPSASPSLQAFIGSASNLDIYRPPEESTS